MSLPLSPPYPPMEARLVEHIPVGAEWQYEPKWDGFRCLVFKDGSAVELQSKSGQPLARYFPEVVEHVRSVPAGVFVLDGEIVVPVDGQLSFDDLLQRIHPAERRIRKLAQERPAVLIVFDMLVDPSGRSLVDRPLRERRRALEAFAREKLAAVKDVQVSPETTDVKVARGWLRMAGGSLDGIVAKRVDFEYRSGDRTGMQKVKRQRTADCVVGGFRYATKGRVIGSLLLGLYDADGLLHHVGFAAGFPASTRKALLAKVRPLIKPPGFTGRAPGGPS
ncbi:MAG TPA: ATP-dependent DNA ligase, partial [Methylomirabilota bacterium]